MVNADVQEAALLLELVLVIHGPDMRQEPLFHPYQEDDIKLQPLGRMKWSPATCASLVSS